MVEKCLLALQAASQIARPGHTIDFKLSLVDNSSDSAVHHMIGELLEGLRPALSDWSIDLVLAPGNVGYGQGNNLAIATAQSDYHLVINPDLFVDASALLEAVQYMQSHQDVGLLSPAVYGEDGEQQWLCKRNPTLLVMFLRSFAPAGLKARLSHVIARFEMRDCDYTQVICPIEYPTGCFMFFRTAPLQAIGGFDPEFFLHYEDADIGRRMLQVAPVAYVPAVRVMHLWARDTHRSWSARWITVKSGLLYWRKWGGVFYSAPSRASK